MKKTTLDSSLIPHPFSGGDFLCTSRGNGYNQNGFARGGVHLREGARFLAHPDHAGESQWRNKASTSTKGPSLPSPASRRLACPTSTSWISSWISSRAS